jgi:hypothetical protein
MRDRIRRSRGRDRLGLRQRPRSRPGADADPRAPRPATLCGAGMVRRCSTIRRFSAASRSGSATSRTRPSRWLRLRRHVRGHGRRLIRPGRTRERSCRRRASPRRRSSRRAP